MAVQFLQGLVIFELSGSMRVDKIGNDISQLESSTIGAKVEWSRSRSVVTLLSVWQPRVVTIAHGALYQHTMMVSWPNRCILIRQVSTRHHK